MNTVHSILHETGVLAMVVSAIFLPTNPPPGMAAEPILLRDDFDGIALLGLSPPPEAAYDVPITPPGRALEKIKEALSLIRRQSPFNAARIQNLKNSGPITVIYDPRYPDPKADVSKVRVAVFLPNVSREDGNQDGDKKFFALIGRHGIKWPLPEFAAVLVHELVGHGMQHLLGRTETTRSGDLECEASLYQERMHQDLGMDKFSPEMIAFQKQLAETCRNFLRYHEAHIPDHARILRRPSPDVSALLATFEKYLTDPNKGIAR